MSVARYDGTIRTAVGEAISGVDIYVCTQPNTVDPDDPTIPPSPLASVFSDSAGTVPIVQPVESDGLGNFFFYAAPAQYTFVIFDPLGRVATQVYPDQTVATPGGGSVSSVGMTVSAAGLQVSPATITSSGTFVVSYTSDWAAHFFLAGPTSGGASTPTRRAIVAGDLPGGVGTVSSVGVDVVPDANLAATVLNSPVTSSDTIEIDIGMAPQAANTVIAGPASGSTGPVTARHLVPADLASQVNTTFSATPTFDASAASSFRIVLTGDVTSSTVTNPTSGQRLTFIVIQDGTGGRAFAWPANFRGASVIAPDASLANVQDFVYDGTAALWRATGPGLTMS